MDKPRTEPAGACQDEVELTIEKIVYEGRALAHMGRQVVFVEGALPGERVRVEIRQRKKQYVYARVLEILESSPHRVPAECPVFGRCGGCTFLDCAYAEQREIKRGIVVDALRQWPALAAQVLPTLGTDDPRFFRNKMVYAFGLLDGRMVLGMHERGNFRQCLPADACLLQSEGARETIRRMLAFVAAEGLTAFDPMTKAGLLRDLVVREGKRTGQRMVQLVATAWHPAFERLPAALGELADTVLASVSPADFNSSRLTETRLLKGGGGIEEKLDDFVFEIAPATFFQTNTLQAEKMFRLVADWAAETKPAAAMDLYCGIGPIAFYLRRAAREVVGIESQPDAIAAARRNAGRNGLQDIEWHAVEVEKAPFPVFRERMDLIVVDPPRAGLHPRAAERIIGCGPGRVIYISCNPATLARDLALFFAAGYTAARIQPVDMFPHTWHVECVVLLERA